MKGKTKPKPEAKTKPPPPPPPQPDPERCMTPQVTTYDTINEAVHEYLLKSGLFKTVDSFQVSLIDNTLFSKSWYMESPQSTVTSKILRLDKTLANPIYSKFRI